jgi:PAS domain S-box-containing protein
MPVSVLCVDDEVTHRIILQRLVSPCVDSMYLAEDGQSGLTVFAEKRPDIVITDLMMPRKNGLEMSRAIRSIDPDVPIILMTSCNSSDFFSEATDIGISQFLPKPVIKDNLLNSLQRCYSMIDIQRRLKSGLERTHILTSALEQSPTAIIIIDPGGTIDFMNHICTSRYGWCSDEMQGNDFLRLNLNEELNQLVSLALEKMTQADSEILITLPDGEVSVAKTSVSVFRTVGGENKLLVTLDDITEKRVMETHLLRSQKLESLSVLAGGIAHNFNNILTAIIGNAELAIMRLPPDSTVLPSMENIKISALRAARLAQQMLAYSGRGDQVGGESDLNAMLVDMLAILEVSVSRQVAVRIESAPGSLPIKADVSQIREILMNLVINASEAIGKNSGHVCIATGRSEFGQADLKNFWPPDGLKAGCYVFLEVSDNGCGMDAHTASKLFDPFFSTKFTGRGLGMALVLGIVKDLGGAIKVTTEVDKGSSFKILLPARV